MYMYCDFHFHFPCQNASSDVDKMILGNKCDLAESRVISTERGKLVWESEYRNGKLFLYTFSMGYRSIGMGE